MITSFETSSFLSSSTSCVSTLAFDMISPFSRADFSLFEIQLFMQERTNLMLEGFFRNIQSFSFFTLLKQKESLIQQRQYLDISDL